MCAPAAPAAAAAAALPAFAAAAAALLPRPVGCCVLHCGAPGRPPAPTRPAAQECELLAHVYWKMYGLSMTGLRFFTVYGPWGRPDMAFMAFAHKILAKEPIKVYQVGHGGAAQQRAAPAGWVGKWRRVATCLTQHSPPPTGTPTATGRQRQHPQPRLHLHRRHRGWGRGRHEHRAAQPAGAGHPQARPTGAAWACIFAAARPSASRSPQGRRTACAKLRCCCALCRIYNLGGSRTTSVLEMIALLEAGLGKRAVIEHERMEGRGEVLATHANVSKAGAELGYAPRTPIQQGAAKFVKWFKAAYKPEWVHVL